MTNATAHQINHKFPYRHLLVAAFVAVCSVGLGTEVSSQAVLPSNKFGEPPSLRDPRFQQAIQQAIRHAKQVADAQAKVAEANKEKANNPSAYINALVSLAYVYRDDKETKSAAEEIYNEAFEIFTTNSFNSKQSIDPDSLQAVHLIRFWNYLSLLPAKEFDAKFIRLLKASAPKLVGASGEFKESRRERESKELDALIFRTIEARRDDNKNQKKYLKAAVDTIASVAGTNDGRLEPFVRRYAAACELDNELEEAEKQYIRANSLVPFATSEEKENLQIDLAEFYLRHSRLEKANTAFDKATIMYDGKVSEGLAKRFIQFLVNYQSAQAEGAERIIDKLLDIGGDDLISALDPKLYEVVRTYVDSGSHQQAEALLCRRIVATETCTHDTTANDWLLWLSGEYLASGRESESKKLFDRVKKSVAQVGGPTDTVIEMRIDLLEKMGKVKQADALRKTLSKSETKAGPIVLKYGLLARKEMRFGAATRIGSYDSSSTTRDRNADSSICCFGAIELDGFFSYYGRIFSMPMTPDSVRNLKRKQVVDPPERTVIGPALKAPASAVVWAGGTKLGTEDYIATNLKFVGSSLPTTGRTRIFLKDEIGAPSIIESTVIGFPRNSPANIQIWYQGMKRLRINGFNGIIYAPNATVEIPSNRRFSGAIVANKIIGEGNSSFQLDSSLINKTFEP